LHLVGILLPQKMIKLAQLVMLLTCGKWPVEIQDTDTAN